MLSPAPYDHMLNAMMSKEV
jgi:hypothetical protein